VLAKYFFSAFTVQSSANLSTQSLAELKELIAKLAAQQKRDVK